MRGFILGAVCATGVATWLGLGGENPLSNAWANFERQQKIGVLEELAKERELAFTENYRAPTECIKPASELKRLECRNRMDYTRANFYALWNQQNASRFPK